MRPFQGADDVLRDAFGLTTVRTGCGAGDCGDCTVAIDGRATCSCMTPALALEGADVWTAEGLATHPDPHARVVQQAIETVEERSCGHCLPALAMTTLSAAIDSPSLSEYVDIPCRCGAWHALLGELKSQKKAQEGIVGE